ncbi:ribonuclease H-like domain-containing protein [Tanacetum coccineum]
MDLETAQLTTTAKLPTLKQGEYEMWRLRIEQYFQVQDYALWDVIENGNSFQPAAKTTTNADGTSTTLIPGPVTTEEKVQKKNDMKARSMLLMALPNEHLMTFNRYKDAKTLFVAIQTRVGGNEATKKTQKTLLKQMLQKIVRQLAILGENILQEDLNLKFLRSLPFEWNTHVVFWRNKPDLDPMSFDISTTISRLLNKSTNEVNTAYRVSTANTQVSPASTQVSTASTQDLEQIHEDDIEEMDLKWQLALLSMRTRRFFQKTGRKITINGSDTAGYDKSKVKCFNCHKMRHFARECRGPRNQDSRNRNQDNSRRTVNVEETSSKAMVAIDGAGFDWSYMADDEVPTNMALMAFSDSEVHNDKTCSKTCLKSFETLKTQLDDLRIEFNKSEFNLATYKRGLASVEEQLVFYKKNEVIFCEQLAVLKRDISYKDSEISMLKSELEKLKQEKESNQLKIENFDNASKSLDKLIGSQITDKSRKGVGFADYNYHQRESVVSGNNFTRVNYNYSAKKAHPIAHRNMVPREVLMKTGLRSLITDKVLLKVNVVRANQVNAVRASAKLGFRSSIKNLMEDMLPLDEELKEGNYCASQMCDKKNSVLFTNTGYFVLSPDFKLVDESQVLLKVPRKNNMYSVDMKNIVPKKSLTCLVAKATLDESMLWHSRLGHVNFKTINKLVKENLVRGLPLKCFENDQTYVACLKRKQHKASYKAASTGVDARYGGTTTTITGLKAGQGSGNIDKTPIMPYDSPLPRVNTLRSDECSIQLEELMVFYINLSKKVESLETDLKQTKQVYGATYTKLIMKVKKLENKVKTNQARKRARIIVSDDEDDLEDPSKQGKVK